MSHELFEVTCVKHQHIEQTANPETWLCKFCKEQKEHPFRHFNRCDKGHKWFGNESCPECKIDLMKKRALRRLPYMQEQKKMIGSNDSSLVTMEKKRIAKLELEKKVKESTLKLPELLTELITEIKGLREDLKHV